MAEEYHEIEKREEYVEERHEAETVIPDPKERRMLEVIAGGSFAELAGGIGAVVLAIIGLAGAAPVALAAICALSIGGAILLESLSVGAEFSKLTGRIDGPVKKFELGTGLGAEFFAGAGAVTLGILALMGINPQILLPVTAIVLGAGYIFAIGAKQRVNALRTQATDLKGFRRVSDAAVKGSVGGQVLVGIAAVVLGILGLMTPNVILTLVAMLAMGAMGMLGGTVLAGRMFSMAKARRREEVHAS